LRSKKTGEERRQNGNWNMPIHSLNQHITARIPHPTSLMLGHLPPGGRLKYPIDKAYNRVYSIGIHMNDCSYMEIKEDLVWSRRSII